MGSCCSCTEGLFRSKSRSDRGKRRGDCDVLIVAVQDDDGCGFDHGPYSRKGVMVSSFTGPDGAEHTERLATHEVGDRRRGIREARAVYYNSAGVEGAAHSQQFGERGRLRAKGRNRRTQEEFEQDDLFGMDEDERDDFDRNFAKQRHGLPQIEDADVDPYGTPQRPQQRSNSPAQPGCCGCFGPSRNRSSAQRARPDF